MKMSSKMKILGLVLSSALLVACGDSSSDLRNIKVSQLTDKQLMEVRSNLNKEEMELVKVFEILRIQGRDEVQGEFSYNEMIKNVRDGLAAEKERAKAGK